MSYLKNNTIPYLIDGNSYNEVTASTIPEKLEKYLALRECYEQYKLLEAMINDK